MTQTRNWAVVLVAAALATGVAVVGKAVNRDDVPRICAAVGLETETSGRTPDEAFAAFIASRGGRPSQWERGAEFGEHGYRPIDTTARPDGYGEIHVRESEPGIWRVGGACV